MNTLRDNLDQRIRKQIEEREITPSRDLWTEIEMQTAETPSKSKVNWMMAAACIILAFGLGFVLFFNQEKEDIQNSRMTEVRPENVQHKAPAKINSEVKPALAEKKQIKTQENIEILPSETNKEIPASKALAEEVHKVSVKEKAPLIAPVVPQVPIERIIAKTEDSSKNIGKKKRYVDPSTLLFSVEHKDIIQKTKESNVATIDLNGK
ncbi:hypothetical protein [Chryseobacterium kwangjuense]|uniref:Uncharacterized protein n=1 Tax=Chryseobacterium kwangjuense TaxID=267125 RepID=A0A135WF75_9FLAO|nr:hypothetical protein [Chryseobacterium kwangjuense]KXH83557.1 hypothetical protein AU378_14305 [Chryseobacterium kwangjuense]